MSKTLCTPNLSRKKISLRTPMVKFGGLKNIEEIVDVMHSKLVQR